MPVFNSHTINSQRTATHQKVSKNQTISLTTPHPHLNNFFLASISTESAPPFAFPLPFPFPGPPTPAPPSPSPVHRLLALCAALNELQHSSTRTWPLLRAIMYANNEPYVCSSACPSTRSNGHASVCDNVARAPNKRSSNVICDRECPGVGLDSCARLGFSPSPMEGRSGRRGPSTSVNRRLSRLGSFCADVPSDARRMARERSVSRIRPPEVRAVGLADRRDTFKRSISLRSASPNSPFRNKK